MSAFGMLLGVGILARVLGTLAAPVAVGVYVLTYIVQRWLA